MTVTALSSAYNDTLRCSPFIVNPLMLLSILIRCANGSIHGGCYFTYVHRVNRQPIKFLPALYTRIVHTVLTPPYDFLARSRCVGDICINARKV